MAIVYEHWRPDTGVCFYVGASRIGVSRAMDFGADRGRNKRHVHIVGHLRKIGLQPEVRIVYEDIPDDCVGAFEKIRIAYQRSLHGAEMTNITDGGDGGPIMFGVDNPMANPVTRQRQKEKVPRGDTHPSHRPEWRQRMTGDNNPMKRDTVRQKNAKSQQANGRWKGDNHISRDSEHRDKWRASLARGEDCALSKARAAGLLSGENHYFNKFPEKKARAIQAARAGRQSESGRESYRLMGVRLKESGARKGEKNNMFGRGDRLEGCKNGRAKLKEQDTLEIRASKLLQKELAVQYGVSIYTIRDIQQNRTWTHVVNNDDN